MRKDGTVVTVGETMAMFRAVTSAPIAPDSLFDFGVGGAESNVAIGLARLGVSATWVSQLGNDDFGAVIQQTLESEGVRVLAGLREDRPTGLMVKIPVDEDDPRVRYYRRGSAASSLVLGRDEKELLSQARWIHLSGIFPALSDTTTETAHEIVDFAVAEGIPYSLDINYRPQLWTKSQARSTLLGLACDAEIVFGGRAELEILVGEHDSDSQLLRAVADCGPREVVAKLGADGALALFDERQFSTEALPVEVVDTVGAGDAFVAGYLSQRLVGETSAQALRRGAVCGALVCTKAGDWEGAPFLEEVTSYETGALV